MQGKTVLITGGNAGIGKETAKALANQGARIVIVSRSKEKGQKAVEELRQVTGNPEIHLLQCDLSSLEQVRRMASEFLSGFDRLDVLINNAGLVLGERKFTREGFEMTFGVNHLAHFLLTHLLLDRIKASAPARIINVSSKAHYSGKLNFDSLKGAGQKYSGVQAYSQSKLCNVFFTRYLSNLLADSHITVNCLHPGVVRTRIGNKSNFLFSLAWTLLKPFMIGPGKGASTSVYLASAPEVKDITGKYFDEKIVQRKVSATALNDELSEKLWQYSLKVCGLTAP